MLFIFDCSKMYLQFSNDELNLKPKAYNFLEWLIKSLKLQFLQHLPTARYNLHAQIYLRKVSFDNLLLSSKLDLGGQYNDSNTIN